MKTRNLYKQWIILVIIFCFLWIGIIYSFILKNDKRRENFLNSEYYSFTSRISSILGSYENFASYILLENAENKKVQKIIKEAYYSDEARRKELGDEIKNLLNKEFQRINYFGFDQVSFYFPSGDVFFNLWEKQTLKQADDLRKIKISNIEKRYIKSFKDGKVYEGYKFIFIVYYDKQYFGVVEFFISLTKLIEIFSTFYPDMNIFYYVPKDSNLEFSTDPKNHNFVPKNYKLYFSADDQKTIPPSVENEILRSKIKNIEKNLKNKNNFGYISSYENKNYSILFIPINGENDKNVGYLHLIYENNLFESVYSNLITELFLVNLVILTALLATLFFIRDRNKFLHLSTIDFLTKLFNRSKFLESAEYEFDRNIRYDIPFSICLIDVDHFKNINDNYGHNIGDMILKELANIFQKNSRKTDIYARWGGEEFICLLPGNDEKSAYIVAEKLRKIVEEKTFNKVGKVTISIGIREKQTTDFTLEEVIEKADKALYIAKNSGRNRVENLK